MYQLIFFKWVAALLIIAIHTHPLCNMNETVNFLFSEVVVRLAVPFFAVTTGYFLKKENVKKQLIKVVKLYIGSNVLYLPFLIIEWKESGWLTIRAFIDWIVGLFTSGGYYHLWYLLGLIYALPIYYLFVSSISDYKMLRNVAVLVWIIECVLYTDVIHYSSPSFITLLLQILDITSRILSLLLLGGYIRENQNNIYKFRYFIFSFIVLIIEVFTLKELGCTKFSYVLSTLLVVYYSFNLIKDIKSRVFDKVKVLFRTSDLIYIIHPAIVFVLLRIGLQYGFLLFVFTVLLSMIVSSTIVFWREK